MRISNPFSRLFAIGLVLLFAAGAAEAAQPLAMNTPAPVSAQPDNDDYTLGTGDKIRVIVFDNDDLGGEYQVDAKGYVRLPLIGQVKAAGLSAHQLEATIATALRNGYLTDPAVNVEITTYRPFYIMGEVSKPGEYPYVNGMNALTAVALAGGFTQAAKQSVIYIRAQGSTVEHRMPADQSTEILPGDVLRVDSTTFWDIANAVSPFTGIVGIAAARVP